MSFRDEEGFYQVPDIVKQWAHYFYRHIRRRNIPEIQSMYEISFLKLSDRYYKAAPWPEVQHIAEVVDHDHVFCLLYKEMYFRHLYARCQPTLRDRCESWDNYCELFGLLLTSNVNMQLPNVWLWDMVDEFLYQFQSFCQYRGKVQSMSPEEIDNLKKCDKAIYPLNLHERSNLFTPRIPGVHITLFYYGGFSYLMQRRYLDAARCFNAVLLFIYRVKGAHRTSPHLEQMLKKNEQMYALLAVVCALCPAAVKSLDENVLMQFHIDVDPESGREMVMVSDTQQVATYAPFLSHHISRFEEIIRELSALTPPPVSPAVVLPAAAAVRV
ncbi:Eukaryotic translation initiation factor 3 subunit L [Tetrabaena socialis]|uniref:Eukaryotic translation initiation factor 3 subunit L n=1 Tax=Tetrabaena socialis TaxID=47790 RepID=A0A2J8A3H2_9CHLO|nr:Eukaryotic translation initiation factor 3 subunit L [Tetrabaena socialis]|eukprot:PNH07077.1 Eukaryotic translation initiation factor 3 subunit L [Tetrabaena socialis]